LQQYAMSSIGGPITRLNLSTPTGTVSLVHRRQEWNDHVARRTPGCHHRFAFDATLHPVFWFMMAYRDLHGFESNARLYLPLAEACSAMI
jgi:hypothetical protein